MSENPQLIETSFKDAIALIAAAEELPAGTRLHWATSLRRLAKALDRPVEVIPARYSAVRAEFSNLHAVPAGLAPKTLQNHKSNAKSALLWLARSRARSFAGLQVRLEDALNSFMVPATAGVLSAIVFFGLLIGLFALPVQANNDVPTMLYTPPVLAQSPFSNGMERMNAESCTDPAGRLCASERDSDKASCERSAA